MNYEPESTVDEGTFLYPDSCVEDLDGNGTVNTSDILICLERLVRIVIKLKNHVDKSPLRLGGEFCLHKKRDLVSRIPFY